jgi:hypothetical protein
MKYPKRNNILKYLLFILGIIVVFLVVRKIEEGFQSLTTVSLYFTVDSMNKPTLVKSSNPGVKYVSSANGGTVVLSINSSLGPLNGFNGKGWSQANTYVSLPSAKLDMATNALNVKQPVGSSTKYLHNPTYSRPMLSSTAEVKLPQQVSTIILGGLDTATFGLGTNPGDQMNNGAKILVTLNF